MRVFNPERRWLRRLNSVGRLTLARRAGLLTDAQAVQLIAIANRVHTRLRFGHGDLTARNVPGGPDGLALIDWEWAGLYPEGYELAFFWFSLVDVEQGRARVEGQLDTDERAFLLSALLVQLWHLQWYVPAEFRRKHLSTRDDLIARLCR
jgi:thiamine kinase-like enzyme